jgi:hypothetical protein
MDLEKQSEVVDSIYLALVAQGRTLVNMVMNLRVSLKAGNLIN